MDYECYKILSHIKINWDMFSNIGFFLPYTFRMSLIKPVIHKGSKTIVLNRLSWDAWCINCPSQITSTWTKNVDPPFWRFSILYKNAFFSVFGFRWHFRKVLVKICSDLKFHTYVDSGVFYSNIEVSERNTPVSYSCVTAELH